MHDSADGEFEPGAYVTMSIIGFNDNFMIVMKNGTYVKGGFVLRSGYGFNEHSYQFFFSTLTGHQEEQICPSLPDPSQWPTPANCTDSCEPIVSCVSREFCDFGDNYTWRGNGTFTNERTQKSVTFPYPIEYIRHVFVPREIPQNFAICGYSFIPYSIVETLEAAVPGSFAFDAVDVSVKFTESSYASSKANRDYTHFAASTFEFRELIVEYPYENLSSTNSE
jgi:hypothetical protein